MPRRQEITIANHGGSVNFNGGGIQYFVQYDALTYYCIFINNAVDVVYRKSTDGGRTWGAAVSIFAGTATALAVWYDRWSNISADLIHVVYSESVTDDTLYRTINAASSDALSTQTVIFAGASTAANGHLSVTRAVGGNVYCKTVIDSGAEGGFYRLANANVPNGAWDAARTVDEAIATADSMILVPGFAADTQDIMAFFWDASANEISRKIYDDSANTWAETSIATSMTELAASTAHGNMAAAVDISNSRSLLVAWSATDTLNADLRCWHVTESAITEVTAVVTDSTDDQGLCAIGIDTVTGYWYVFYAGKTDGSETWLTALNVYYKISKDSGTTWGPETKISKSVERIEQLYCTPRSTGPPLPIYARCSTDLATNVDITLPKANYIAGVM